MSKDKTVVQELIEVMNKDQVSFTEWFLDNYQVYLEKEKTQTIAFGIMAGIYACKNRDQLVTDGREYLENVYDKIYKQN